MSQLYAPPLPSAIRAGSRVRRTFGKKGRPDRFRGRQAEAFRVSQTMQAVRTGHLKPSILISYSIQGLLEAENDPGRGRAALVRASAVSLLPARSRAASRR